MTSSYFSRRWLHAEASFSRNAGRVGGGGEGQFRSHSPSLAHGSPSMRTHPHARTLVVHRSRARTLLISCPPEATAGGSAPLIDRPNPFFPDDACAAPGSANDFLFDDLLSLVKRRNWGEGGKW